MLRLKVKLFSWKNKDKFLIQDAESRAEYGEMNVQRIHLQIDQLEDELIGQKQKCKAINDELQQTFNDMVNMYWENFWQDMSSQETTHFEYKELFIYVNIVFTLFIIAMLYHFGIEIK